MFRSYSFRSAARICSLPALLLTGSLALAQEFSADVVTTKPDNTRMSKVYAGKNKVRFEVAGGNAAMGPSAIIFDDARHTYTVVMTDRRMYMDAPPMMVKPMITNYWRVQDVNDACPDWKKTAEAAGTDKNWGSCTKIGSDNLNGRSAVKYEGVSKKGEKMHVWVDTKLNVSSRQTNPRADLSCATSRKGRSRRACLKFLRATRRWQSPLGQARQSPPRGAAAALTLCSNGPR